MKKPEMIIFDYGQTLVNEQPYNGLRGTEAILRLAAKNRYNVPAEEIQEFAEILIKEIRWFGTEYRNHNYIEVHNHMFQNYLYEYFGVEFTEPQEEIERIFNEAGWGKPEPTAGIIDLLDFLVSVHIRTGVISNISFSGKLVNERIKRCIPSHEFEFIIPSSEYVFRKPNKRIFELALRKAQLNACDVWYCGDNAIVDIDGAGDCGIFPVWYKGAFNGPDDIFPTKDCLEINNWSELMNILKHHE